MVFKKNNSIQLKKYFNNQAMKNKNKMTKNILLITIAILIMNN